MRKGYKIVCNTASGRSRYMKLLIPFVLSCDIVDRYDLWINTLNEDDLRFFELLSKKYSKINLMYIDNNNFNGIGSIYGFYKRSMDDDTIYIKLDDDIIWMEPDAIEKMVDFRIDHPEYFIVSPLVINNASGAYLLQNGGKIKFKKYLPAFMTFASAWCNDKSAYELLDWFYKMIEKNTYEELHMGAKPIAMQRFSINMILWFGKDVQLFKGIINRDDEEELSVIIPTKLGKANCINTDTLVTHFAFTFQRIELDKTDILKKYESLIVKGLCGKRVLYYYKEINQLIIEAKTNKNIKIPHYKDIREKKRFTLRSFIGQISIPYTYYNISRLYNSFKEHIVRIDR